MIVELEMRLLNVLFSPQNSFVWLWECGLDMMFEIVTIHPGAGKTGELLFSDCVFIDNFF